MLSHLKTMLAYSEH